MNAHGAKSNLILVKYCKNIKKKKNCPTFINFCSSVAKFDH